ncbi:MAG TPA: RNase A-like domain-containing protein [Jatrophihabitans sp.]|nr:RNase A-like domain-containing protein [Jatrophihabitans sp.]
MANRAAAVAAELQRVRARLSGALAVDGWTGAARLAFDSELAERLKQLDPAIARYDGCAAGLMRYASRLDQTLPALQAARAGLTQVAPGMPGAFQQSHEVVPGPSPSQLRFERLWQQWDDDRRSCVSALERAARCGADRHGFARLWHAAGHVVHEISHVNLAEISKALDELGNVLFVAALALSPVPGLGEAMWTAVALVSAAKLAVDATRVARGDKSVSKGDLAWDAMAAIPGGGRMSKEAKEAAGLEKSIVVKREVSGLAPDATHVNIVPGGGLSAFEGCRGMGGHAIKRHVGKSYSFLVSRFKNPTIFRASSYLDRATAEHAIAGALRHADAEVNAWLATGVRTLVLKAHSGAEVGVTVSRLGGQVPRPTTKFVIILEREPAMPLGYKLPTSFPAP